MPSLVLEQLQLWACCPWWHSSRSNPAKPMTIRSANPFLSGPPRPQRGAVAHGGDDLQRARDKELQPAYLADADPNRALLDRRVVCDLLGFDEDTYAGVRRLAAKWCAEPSVHGGKARPRNASLIV